MGYNLYARCLDHGEVAFVYRGHEAQAIREWYRKHPRCRVEWAVDNTHTTPAWVDERQEVTELPIEMAVKHVG